MPLCAHSSPMLRTHVDMMSGCCPSPPSEFRLCRCFSAHIPLLSTTPLCYWVTQGCGLPTPRTWTASHCVAPFSVFISCMNTHCFHPITFYSLQEALRQTCLRQVNGHVLRVGFCSDRFEVMVQLVLKVFRKVLLILLKRSPVCGLQHPETKCIGSDPQESTWGGVEGMPGHSP